MKENKNFKSLGIFLIVAMMCLSTTAVLSVSDSVEYEEHNNFVMDIQDSPPYSPCDLSDRPAGNGGIWFLRGIFKFLDEDEEHIYLNAISAKLHGFGDGVAFYRLFFCPLKISKPIYGIFTNDFSIVVIGICRHWDYI